MESHHVINPIMAHHVFQAHNYTTTRPVEVAGCLPFDIGEGDELTSRSACSLSSYQSAVQWIVRWQRRWGDSAKSCGCWAGTWGPGPVSPVYLCSNSCHLILAVWTNCHCCWCCSYCRCPAQMPVVVIEEVSAFFKDVVATKILKPLGWDKRDCTNFCPALCKS